MAPYIADNQADYSEHYIKSSGDPFLGLSKSSHTLGKPTPAGPGSPGVFRRHGLPEHHHHPDQTTMTAAPTIRVIHIFAPKIIKTDVANFRSTVQRLTGRPARGKADTTGSTQPRRARTKTVAAAAAATSPDSSGFQEAEYSPTFSTVHQSSCISTPLRDSSMSQSHVVGGASADHQAGSPVAGCCNTMEIDNCSLTSNDCVDDSSTFSFYTSMDSQTSNNHESPQDLYQGCSMLHPPAVSSSAADGIGSFFSHRQTPYALNEIPAPFFSGDILHSCTEFMMPSCNSTQDFAYHQTHHVPICMSSKDSAYSIGPLPSIPPLDYNGLAGFSDLDNILTGLQGSSTLPDLALNLPPLVSGSSNGLFYDTFFMQPPLCR
jgi:hypothetical protein